jgi:hypothetical protein
MAKTILSDALIVFDGYAIRESANAVSIDYGAEELDGTTLADNTRIMVGGLLTAAMGAEGFFDAPNPDSAFFDQMGLSEKVITIAPKTVEGGIGYSLNALLGSYNPGAPVGELLKYSISAGAQDRLVRGTLLANKTGIITSGSGTAFQVGAATATQTIFAALHVVGATGTTPTLDLIVESDDAVGMTTPTTRITFAQATGVGSQFKKLAGPVTDSWWRVKYTLGGATPNFGFVVLVGILENR